MDQRDIVYQIFNELSLNDIVRCSTVNRLINHICDLQYARLINDYENILANLFYKSSCKQMYVACYELERFVNKYSNLDLFNFFSANGLVLYHKNINKLPETIGQLVNLQELSLSDNQITELPETIGQLINLQELWLDKNKITGLPETIGQLVNLQELTLDNNQITGLPETIGQLVNLQKLWLHDNKITELPGTIGQLVNCEIIR